VYTTREQRVTPTTPNPKATRNEKQLQPEEMQARQNIHPNNQQTPTYSAMLSLQTPRMKWGDFYNMQMRVVYCKLVAGDAGRAHIGTEWTQQLQCSYTDSL
jgi:hypothetical protein